MITVLVWVKSMSEGIDFRVFYLKKNMGHGNARRKGLAECRNNLVALMDADDISLPYRFEKQLEFFSVNPKLSIVGGQIAEFVDSTDNIIGIREVPIDDSSIKKYMKRRCPMNQPSVMFKKDDVERAGGYIDWYCEEDYYLWARMALIGCEFCNSSEVLLNFRAGDQMSARRGGIKYFKSEARMQTFLLKEHIISPLLYFYNLAIRFAGEVIIPNSIRVKLYRMLRKPKPTGQVMTINAHKESAKSYSHMPFSVSMCVYGGDNSEWVDAALDSIVNQSVKPQEIVVVVDGPIPNSLQEVVNKYTILCQSKI